MKWKKLKYIIRITFITKIEQNRMIFFYKWKEKCQWNKNSYITGIVLIAQKKSKTEMNASVQENNSKHTRG